ncbi:hypothetical protein [Nocardia sp. NPDC127526]|uniref:baeRF2 domain-containing protein n=1 Tax=Nocardia sp. NPDC127526 TaxID=3345393 RepID=UPI0036282A4F
MVRTSLRELLSRTGPFASVYFDSSHDTEDAVRQVELGYRSIRQKLAEAGASDQVIGAVGIAVAAGPSAPGRSGRALIADSETVVVDDALPAPPPREIVRVSPLPHVLPLLEQRPPRVPHVLVTVDDAGARLLATTCHGDRLARTVDVVVNPVHRVRGGPRTHRPRRDRARNLVRHTVESVSEAVCTLADRVGATLILLAGDPAIRSALRVVLDDRYTVLRRCRCVEIDGFGDEVDEQARKIVAEAAGIRRKAVLERYEAECTRAGGAATRGLAATATALRATAVAHLLIDGRELGDREVFAGDSRSDIAATTAELPGPARVRRADEAVPMAALAGGSDIVPVTGRITLPEGVGALLRLR